MSQHVLITNLTGATSVRAVSTGLDKTLDFAAPSAEINATYGLSSGNALMPCEITRLWVTFENMGTTIPHHECDVVWSFDDPGTFSATSQIPGLVALGRNDRNRQVGWETIHGWETEGQKAVTADVYYKGALVVSASATIHVADPFSDASDHVLILPSGVDDSDAPAHATKYAGFGNMVNWPAQCGIWLKYGTEFDIAGGSFSVTQDGPKKWLFKMYGDPADGPVRFYSSTGSDPGLFSFNFKNVSQWSRVVVRDIFTDATYDPSDYSGATIGGPSASSNYIHLSIFRCRFKGPDNGPSATGAYAPQYWKDEYRTVLLFNTFIEGHKNYSCYNGTGRIYIRGSVLKAADDADAGHPDHDTHGNVRMSVSYGVIVQNSYLFSISGWSGGSGNGNAGVSSVQSHQQNLRSNVSGYWGPPSTVIGNFFEGSPWVNGGSSGSRAGLADVVFAYNLILNTSNNARPVYVSMGSFTMKRNVFVQPYSKKEQSMNPDMIGCSLGGYDQSMAFFHVYQNTFLSLMHPTENMVGFNELRFKDADATPYDWVAGNVFIAPYFSNGEMNDDIGNFDLGTAIATPRYRGMYSIRNGYADPSFAVPAQDPAGRDQVVAPTPQPSANAYRSYTEDRVASLDFFWRRIQRSTGVSAGAVDPDAVAL